MRILNSPDSANGGGSDRKNPDGCTIVIFGASGDLTVRKLIPALYHLFKEKQMPSSFRVVGFARREKTDASWRQELRAGLDQFSRTKPVDDKVWSAFAENVFYCQGDLTDEAAFRVLNATDSPHLGILMRPEPRETAASLWLKPPSGLRAFLKKWNKALAAA